MWKHALAGALLLAAGCAPKTLAPDPGLFALQQAVVAAGRAEARVLDGCYKCLLEARDTYTSLLDGPLAESVRPRLFEAALLVTLREKELALPFESSLTRAKAAAEGLPEYFSADRLLAIVEAIPPEVAGWGVLPVQEFTRARSTFAMRSAGEVAWVATSALQPAVRTYLSLAVVCAEIPGPFRDQRAVLPTPEDPPLVAYRRATCRNRQSAEKLQELRVSVPDFTELAYFLMRTQADRLILGTNWQEFRGLLGTSLDALPDSPAVTYVAGRGRQLLGSCPQALALYDRTIELTPRHEDAWLGKTMCLSFLGQREASIGAATTLLALKSEAYARDAYYWRAANHHQLKNLAAARSDIDNAKRRGATIEIATLAGIIEYEQDALEEARRDLRAAQRMSDLACAPTWYLGLVHIKAGEWPDAGSAFEKAVSCYRQSVLDATSKLNGLADNSTVDPDYKRQQVAALQAAIVEYTRQQRASAINAAMCLTNAGDLSRNDLLLAIAAEDPDLAPEIERLRTHIKAYYTNRQ